MRQGQGDGCRQRGGESGVRVKREKREEEEAGGESFNR